MLKKHYNSVLQDFSIKYFLPLLFLLLNGCSSPHPVENFSHEFMHEKADNLWNILPIATKDYPKGYTLDQHIYEPYTYTLLKQNPGFIKPSALMGKRTHILQEVKHLYMHYFFRSDHYIYQIIVEFKTQEDAKTYAKHLLDAHHTQAKKVFRIKNFVFAFQVRDKFNHSMQQNKALEPMKWINQRISTIKDAL